jgi:hypothetical protein
MRSTKFSFGQAGDFATRRRHHPAASDEDGMDFSGEQVPAAPCQTVWRAAAIRLSRK